MQDKKGLRDEGQKARKPHGYVVQKEFAEPETF
jgi:hypothetical protein